MKIYRQGCLWGGRIPYIFDMMREIDDWTKSTLPSWIDSVLEGLRRPNVLLKLGPGAVIKGLREIPTIMLMHWAFANGLMQFGVFRIPR